MPQSRSFQPTNRIILDEREPRQSRPRCARRIDTNLSAAAGRPTLSSLIRSLSRRDHEVDESSTFSTSNALVFRPIVRSHDFAYQRIGGQQKEKRKREREREREREKGTKIYRRLEVRGYRVVSYGDTRRTEANDANVFRVIRFATSGFRRSERRTFVHRNVAASYGEFYFSETYIKMESF